MHNTTQGRKSSTYATPKDNIIYVQYVINRLYTDLVFVNLLRSTGIDSQHGGTKNGLCTEMCLQYFSAMLVSGLDPNLGRPKLTQKRKKILKSCLKSSV